MIVKDKIELIRSFFKVRLNSKIVFLVRFWGAELQVRRGPGWGASVWVGPSTRAVPLRTRRLMHCVVELLPSGDTRDVDYVFEDGLVWTDSHAKAMDFLIQLRKNHPESAGFEIVSEYH